MSFLDRIHACTAFNPDRYLPFQIDDAVVGFVTPELAARLAAFADVFVVNAGSVNLATALITPAVRTAAVDRVLRALSQQGVVNGWRDELYPVAAHPSAPPLLLIERAAVPLFGTYGSGIHVNGFVGRGADMQMWVGRRSLDKPTAPGKLDQIVAGGKSADHTIWETLLKESEEEASILPEIAALARPVGAISYCTERSKGLRRDVLYTFDIELPEDFIPRNSDGEISEFYLWPISRVMETVRNTDDFEFKCALVVVDFLIRHGFVNHSEPDYLDVVKGLHGF